MIFKTYGPLDISFDNNFMLYFFNRDTGFIEEAPIISSSIQSVVYKVSFSNFSYVIKLSNNEYSDDYSRFLCEMSKREPAVPEIIHFSRCCNNPYKTLLIMEYIEGEHTHGVLPSTLFDNLVNLISDLTNRLQIIEVDKSIFLSISDKLKKCVASAQGEEIVKFGQHLLSIWNMNAQKNDYLCLYDLHRDNLLLDSKECWHIVDYESIINGTKSFSISCLLASSILLENYSPGFVLKFIKSHFFQDKDRVELEVLIRLYIGLSFFSRYSFEDIMMKKYYDCTKLFLKELISDKAMFNRDASDLIKYFSNDLL